MVSFHGTFTSRLNLSQEDKGALMYDAFTALSNINGQAIGQRHLELALQEPKCPHFEMGADYASYCAFASIAKMTPEGKPHFDRARKIAEAQGNAGDLGVVVGIMTHSLYMEVLKSRFWPE